MSNEENNPSGIESEVIRDFVQVQKKELEVRQHEIDQQSKEAEYNYKYSIKALEVQEKDLSNERESNQSALTKVLFFAVVIAILMLVFLGYLVYSGNPELVIEILKGIGYVLAGGAGGYGFGYNKGYTQNNQES